MGENKSFYGTRNAVVNYLRSHLRDPRDFLAFFGLSTFDDLDTISTSRLYEAAHLYAWHRASRTRGECTCAAPQIDAYRSHCLSCRHPLPLTAEQERRLELEAQLTALAREEASARGVPPTRVRDERLGLVEPGAVASAHIECLSDDDLVDAIAAGGIRVRKTNC